MAYVLNGLTTTIKSSVVEAINEVNAKVANIPVFTEGEVLSQADRAKLEGIAAGAEVNQNAFSSVKVGSTTVEADSKTDVLELVAGTNVTLTADAATDKITIAATDTKYNAATTSTAGLLSAADKTKLDGIATGATAYTHPSTHPASMITGLGTAATLNTGTASGNIPVLGSDGKIDSVVLPAIAITDTSLVASQADMLALTAQVGDIAVRTDVNKTFILKTAPATTVGNWQELLTPTSPVQSVAGKTGAVTLAKSDVGLANVDNTSDANKPISTAVQTALDGKASTAVATTTANGLLSSADKTKLDGITGTGSYTLPAATSTVLGGVTVGTNVSVSGGTISVANASTSAKGVVQLTDSVSTDSSTVAATAKAVKTVNDALANKAGTSNATTSTAGLMSGADKTKLDGVATGAQVNQNAFSSVKVGTTTVASSAVTDILELVAGANITLTPDASTKKVTIVGSNTTYSAATTSTAGLLSAADKTKLDSIEASANNYSLPTATGSVIGGVKTGTNITNTSGTISVADGTTSAKGVVKLNNTTNSTSTTEAATANAVKVAYDASQALNTTTKNYIDSQLDALRTEILTIIFGDAENPIG